MCFVIVRAPNIFQQLMNAVLHLAQLSIAVAWQSKDVLRPLIIGTGGFATWHELRTS